MLYRWDRRVIGRIEKGCHAVQVRTGMTNFALARAAHLMVVFCVLVTACWAPPAAQQIVWAIAIFALLYAKVTWDGYAMVEEYYRSPHTTAHPQTNMWRSLLFSRMQSAALTIFCATYGCAHWDEPERLAIWYAGGSAFWLAALYLQCVIPLPPGMSKIQEWKESFQAGFKKWVPIPTRR